jgi:hypothetical protein
MFNEAMSVCINLYLAHGTRIEPSIFQAKEQWRFELRNLYSAPSIIRMIKSMRMKWAGRVARMREKRNAYRILVAKPEGKRPLGRPRRM